jgi:ATP-dependent 26S proteasome regulatory subunit
MYKQNKYIKNKKQKFRSSTDINNYNQFLQNLDQLQKNKNNYNNHNDNNDNNSTKESIDIKLNKINNNYYSSDCCSSILNGIDNFESILERLDKICDPNIYEPIKKDTSRETKFFIPYTKPIIKNKIIINTEINNINDLLNLIQTYPDNLENDYNINMKILHKIKEPLTDLNNMIGMKNLKENIVDQILFYIQNLHTFTSKNSGNDFMHTVIYGPPGTGKTEIAKIMGSIFSKMGMLNKGTFKKVTRSDLIAGYLGQTALKTRDVIKDSLGGVLFIDEAYALGNSDKKDSFSKECIDTLCEALSDNKDNLMVIIAGYESDLNECFFNYNQGLNSRFIWRFKTDDYTSEDLYKIFIKKINDSGWTIMEGEKIDYKWFEKNKEYFKFYGRDIETLFAKIKIAHAKRVFCLDEKIKKKITATDLENGFKIFLKNEEVKKRKDESNYKNILSSMYV